MFHAKGAADRGKQLVGLEIAHEDAIGGPERAGHIGSDQPILTVCEAVVVDIVYEVEERESFQKSYRYELPFPAILLAMVECRGNRAGRRRGGKLIHEHRS